MYTFICLVFYLLLPGTVSSLSLIIPGHDGTGNCSCESQVDSRYFLMDLAQMRHNSRGEELKDIHAAFDRLQKTGRFGNSILDKVERAMHDALLGADTNELKRIGALPPCRSWYYLLFGLAVLIELKVALTLTQIVFILQSMMNMTFEQYGNGINFPSTHGQAWHDMVGKKSSKSFKARQALFKSTPFAGLANMDNENGTKKVKAMIFVLNMMLNNGTYNSIISERTQAALRKALKKRSLRSLTKAVKEQIVVLLPRHGCTVWEFGMWLLIQLSLRGNAVVLDIIRYKVKSQDNSDSFTNDEMNEQVRDSITLDNVAETMTRTVPNSGLGKENVLRVAAQQFSSFNVNVSTSLINYTLPIPDGYEKRYYWSKSRTKGRKSKRKFTFVKTDGSKMGKNCYSVPELYRYLNIPIPKPPENESRKRKRRPPPKNEEQKKERQEEKNEKMVKTKAAKTKKQKINILAKRQKTMKMKSEFNSKFHPIDARVTVSRRRPSILPPKWISYESTDDFIDIVFGTDTTKKKRRTITKAISSVLRVTKAQKSTYNYNFRKGGKR